MSDATDHAPVETLAVDLERLSRDLLHRFQREAHRTGGTTVRMGSVVKLGRSVERWLHATLLWLGATDGFEPETKLRALDPQSPGLGRATAGKIAKTLLACAESSSASRPEITILLEDLRAKSASRVWKLINTRNDVVHGGKPPFAILGPCGDVATLLREQRHAAGWPWIADIGDLKERHSAAP